MLKIYTRTGDKGQTSLFGGKRVAKDDIRVEAYGTVDELNSAIGLAIAFVLSSKYQVLSIEKGLTKIRSDLFLIGYCLANTKYIIQNTKYLKLRVEELEKIIDKLTEKLPGLHNFILPGGGRAGASLHFARTICRRAERRVVSLSKKEKVALEILIYLNRLSDLLFTMARFVNFKEKRKEIIWRKNET